MKNPYLKNLNKIEFVVTSACTGRCKHCSEGDRHAPFVQIDPQIAAHAVRQITAFYDIKTVMAFGGEPLLHPSGVYAIMTAAKEKSVPHRQIITNGYFSKNVEKIGEVVGQLAVCGVNDLLLSVDAFHQETIPLDIVKIFAAEVKRCAIPMRLQPAWLVSRDHDNVYNRKTREILDGFRDMGVVESEGNVVFPEGNARQYLAEYFNGNPPENPYREAPFDIRTLSFSPNGDVLDGNVYRCDVLQILRNYAP